MALYIRQILKDQVVLEKDEQSDKINKNPSPESLKFKFIIKAKVIEGLFRNISSVNQLFSVNRLYSEQIS